MLFRKFLFNRFLIQIGWSETGLWWMLVPDGSTHHYLFDVSIVKRSFPESDYSALQIIILKFRLIIGDCGTKTPNRKSEATIEEPKND